MSALKIDDLRHLAYEMAEANGIEPPSMSWSLGVAAELTTDLRLKFLRREAAG